MQYPYDSSTFQINQEIVNRLHMLEQDRRNKSNQRLVRNIHNSILRDLITEFSIVDGL